MREPKTFKYPRLYWRPAGFFDSERLRIIYPDGRAEWADDKMISCVQPGFLYWVDYNPCWHSEAYADDVNGKIPKSSISGFEAVKLMKRFDKECGYKTIYLGEIK